MQKWYIFIQEGRKKTSQTINNFGSVTFRKIPIPVWILVICGTERNENKIRNGSEYFSNRDKFLQCQSSKLDFYNNFRHFRVNIFYFCNYFVWGRIPDEGSLPEMLIWSILFIKFDSKWCIHLRRGLFLYFNQWRKRHNIIISHA